MNPAQDDLDVNRYVRDNVPDMLTARQRRRRYPTRLHRYLVAYNYLLAERARRGRPLRVCELGIDRGQMLTYTRRALEFRAFDPKDFYAGWTGVDLETERCTEPAYTRLVQADLESDFVPEAGDVYLLLHILEHLRDPEQTLRRVVGSAPEGALIVIGLPCHPHFATRRREKQIRAAPNWNGHVSAFSRKRVRRLLDRLRLTLEQEDGAFLLRASGLWLEDFRLWQKFNLSFGRMFPGWPGEYYCSARKAA